MSVLVVYAVILLIAFMVEALVEYIFGKPFEFIEKIKPYKWLLMYLSLAVGILFAFIYQLDMINLLSSWLGYEIPVNNAGIALTGCAIGRGASFIHDIWKKFFQAKPLS